LEAQWGRYLCLLVTDGRFDDDLPELVGNRPSTNKSREAPL
jgi:hypothetical protein